MGEQMLIVRIFDKKFVKDGASQFQDFRVMSHTSEAMFSNRLPQLSQTVTTFFEA
jgi:hypothetical protein